MTGTRPQLLLVERDEEVQLVAPPFMSRVGDVHVCTTVQAAEGVLHNVDVSVLVIANSLLDDAGLDVLRTVRHRRPCAQVMVLCDQNTTDISAKVLAEGIGDVLVKPFDVVALPKRIERLLEVMLELQRRVVMQRELEARMRHHDRVALLGTVVATVAHEVANPLSVVVTNAGLMADILDRHNPLDEQDRGLVRISLAETLQAAVVIKEYLSRVLRFSREDTRGRWEDDLSETLRMALVFVRGRAQTTGARLHVQPLDALPRVSHHAVAFAQAIVNALTNAMDAAGAYGNVWLTVEESDSDVTVVVRDDGAGLSESDLDRLCEAFFTTKQNGTGLGTSVIRQVMYEHGGTAVWSNRDDGHGVIVRLRLPRRPSSIPPAERFVST